MTEDQGEDAGVGWSFAIGAGLLLMLFAALAVLFVLALLGLRPPWF